MRSLLLIGICLTCISCSSVHQINNGSLLGAYELKDIESKDFNTCFKNVSREREGRTHLDTLMNEFDFSGCSKFYSEKDSILTCSLSLNEDVLKVRLMANDGVLNTVSFKARLKGRVLKLEPYSRFQVNYGILNTFVYSHTYLIITQQDELLLYRQAHGNALFIVFPVFGASHYVEAVFERGKP